MAFSVAHAIIQKYESLSASIFPDGVRPPIYFGEAPIASGGAMVRPPYVIIRDEGTRPEDNVSDAGAVEVGRVHLEVYALELGTVDAIVKAIRFGGQPPGNRAGLDWGTLSLDSPYTHMHLRRIIERRDYAGWDYESRRVHTCRIDYEAMISLEAS